jgi:hypothetical protein
MMVRRFPSFVNVRKTERRAQTITDPLERLRYLRRVTGSAPPSRVPWKLLASLLVAASAIPLHSVSDATVRPVLDLRAPLPTAGPAGSSVPNVWLVDKSADFEVYSNGLRIETGLSVSGEPRWYSLLSRDPAPQWGPRRSQPAGIVFHTTESDQAPFEQEHNRAIKRIGREQLLYVRNRRSYHYLIDRFGRVHRIVAESDVANHAGHSVWADSRWLYIGLNVSFLGVSFEGRTEPDQPPANQAQIHAARVLTEMLRAKYSLPAENCVTHAQVSVNPGFMRIGWHIDWGKNFPFEDLGLPDNYVQPSPALALFGFTYDAVYLSSTSHGIWKGLALAEEQMREAADVQGLAVADYRKLLRKQYDNQKAALRNPSAYEEN